MYEGPISLMVSDIQDNIAKKFTEQTENLIYQEVKNIGIHVDKDELLKALRYDRAQYEKGYHDAYEHYKEEKKLTLNSIIDELYNLDCMRSIVDIHNGEQIRKVILQIISMLEE